ncbi:hypothetical protein ACFL01_04920 [Planctomycetota bacterium]
MKADIRGLKAFARESIHMSAVIQAFGRMGRYRKVFRRVADELGLKIKWQDDWVHAWMQSGIASFYDLNLCGDSEEVVRELIFTSGSPTFVRGMSETYSKKAPRNVYWVDRWDEEKAYTRIRALILDSMVRTRAGIERRVRNWGKRDGFQRGRGAQRIPFGNLVESLRKPGLHVVAERNNMGANMLIPSLLWNQLSHLRTQVVTRETGFITNAFIGLIAELPNHRLHRADIGDFRQLTSGEISRATRAYGKFLRSNVSVSSCDPETLSVGSIAFLLGCNRNLVVIESAHAFYQMWKESGGRGWAGMMKLLREHALEKEMSIVLVRALKADIDRRKCQVPKPADIPYFDRIRKHVDNVFLLYDSQYGPLRDWTRPGNTRLDELQIGWFSGPSFRMAGYCAVDLDRTYDRVLEQKS